MGWLFGKKKIPKVPFPEPQGAEDILTFPSPPISARVIEPASIKEAAGIDEDSTGLSASRPLPELRLPKATPSAKMPMQPAQKPFIQSASSAPLYVKVNIYQRILGELESLRSDVTHLHTVNNHLESSEYNEEANFAKLRRDIRAVHDRLLQIDKTLFKIQGE